MTEKVGVDVTGTIGAVEFWALGDPAHVETRRVPRSEGPELVFRTQRMLVVGAGLFPFEVRVDLSSEEGAAPYERGVYVLQASAVQAGRYGDVELNRRVPLVRVGDVPPDFEGVTRVGALRLAAAA